MKKPESLKDWIVIRNTANDRRGYYFGSYDEFLDECDEDEKNLWVGVPFANWTSDDLAKIFTNKLEDDSNGHRWDWVPSSMLKNMKKIHLTEAEKFSVLMGVYMDWRAY